ncbi:lipocalin-like domain-containing protein [Raineya orbicola]|jgi:hypothetical protein|uniref:Lipocalin-like domain n=1 Tax=Raineya orbicola TaxID=2016530 RepID=A0A2N3I8C7_9BACT|nr:lipocalin family protein [Raineya orbicola]PKQ66566.1 Lipocalin-like domain [Raineya orbicola]
MKKINYFSTILFALLIGLGAFSCKKKQTEPSPQEKILGKWKITAWTMKASNSPTIFDLYAIMDACTKDNYLEFRTGNVALENEGATKCNPSDPQETTGSYTLSADGKTLTFTEGGNTTNSEVLELSNTTMKLKNVQTDSGVTYTSEISFTKI